jgi:hypothetical protein
MNGLPICEAPLLDLGKIEELGQLDPGGAAGLVRRLVELFVVKSLEMLRSPCWAARPLDLDAVARTAHSLKSSSAALGAGRFSALCAQLEHKIRSGEAVEVPLYHAAIQSVYHETAEALTRILPEVTP